MPLGRIKGTMGQASCADKEYTPKVYTVPELMEKLLHFLEDRGPRSQMGWKRALKDAFHGGDRVDFQGFVRVTSNLYSQAEGMQLWTLWSHNGRVERADIEKDLVALMSGSSAIFANANKGASLDPVPIPGKNRSNVESEDFPSNDPDGPFAAKGQLASASARPITAAKPHRPPNLDRGAGVAMVTGATGGTASSVPGGIFSEEFTMADIPIKEAEKHTNWPSLEGGIFKDFSDRSPVPVPAAKRSDEKYKSSVAGGIFAAAARPDTVEYGYERFPRQGLA